MFQVGRYYLTLFTPIDPIEKGLYGDIFMEYKSKYMADYYMEKEPKEFVIVQEVIVLKQYTVEAESMVDAIQQIENENYDCVIDEDGYAEEQKGRIIRVLVNDDE